MTGYRVAGGRADRAAAAHPNPGRPLLHRLNRTEYANAIRDLLALDIDARVAAAGGRLRLRLRQHRRRAGRVAGAAWSGIWRPRTRSARWRSATPTIAPGSETYRVRQDLSQDRHIEGLPLGTVGGLRRAPHLPARRRVHVQGEAVPQQLGTPRGARVRASARDRGRRAACASWRRSAVTRISPSVRQADCHRRRASTRAYESACR